MECVNVEYKFGFTARTGEQKQKKVQLSIKRFVVEESKQKTNKDDTKTKKEKTINTTIKKQKKKTNKDDAKTKKKTIQRNIRKTKKENG